MRLEGALMHGVVGDALSVANGSNFGSGFLAAGVSEFAGPNIRRAFGDDFGGKLLAHATIGGIASRLGGRKFGYGSIAVTFGYLFNEGTHAASNEGDWKSLHASRGAKDEYECHALDVAGGKGNFLERTSDAILKGGAVAKEPIFPSRSTQGSINMEMEQIRVQIKRSCVAQLGNAGGTAQQPVWPSERAIDAFHIDIFSQHGVGAAHLGGNVPKCICDKCASCGK